MGCTALQHRARTGMFAGTLGDGRQKKSKVSVTSISLNVNILKVLQTLVIIVSVLIALATSVYILVMLEKAGGGVSISSTPYAGLVSALLFLPIGAESDKYLSEFSDANTNQHGWTIDGAECMKDWGEQMVGQDDLESEKPVKVLVLVPSGWSPGLVRWWAAGGVVEVAYRAIPGRLGTDYCFDKPCIIFPLTMEVERTVLAGNG